MDEIKELQSIQEEIHNWANQTFGADRGPSLVLKHLVREAKDLLESPYDILAFADVIILLLNAAKEAGHNVEDLILGIQTKHKINLNREWEQLEDGTMSHIKITQI